MESLLPSEMARLVLGYLEEQKCEDAARSFLQSSPHLLECRTVNSSGRRFSTKVNGLTLVEILEKFCAANAIIQERLNKVADCEQLKHCGDLLEQLRFLVDGSRGQRFVVNINVPTTSQVSGGSPIISSSMRKRHHSGSDRERSKRAQKSLSQCLEKNSEPVFSQPSCNAVETTPLENLPGHLSSETIEISGVKNFEKSQELPVVTNCSSTVPEATGPQTAPENSTTTEPKFHLQSFPESIGINSESHEKNKVQCSTATDTKELMQYTNTEVQTTPDDVVESETESTYEPVENLSLLTKELLTRTELHERIADNINKAILPSDTSLRDVSLSESIGGGGGGGSGEMNTSIMTELNNAIKSVVTATESDPVFAQFLDEIIGPSNRNEESPDDNDDQPPDPDKLSSKTPWTVSKDPDAEYGALPDQMVASESSTTEVPLKNRLRSSVAQQLTRSEEDREVTEQMVPKDDAAALEDVNAAAILSIINANIQAEEEKTGIAVASGISEPEVEKANVQVEQHVEIQQSVDLNVEKPVELEKPVEIEKPMEIQSSIELAKPEEMIKTMEIVKPIETEKPVIPTTKSDMDGKLRRKSNIRKPRMSKAKAKFPPIVPSNLISEQDIMAMPTLIVCSKEEISTIMNAAPIMHEAVSSGGYRASQFLPIAPKTAEVLSRPPKPEPIYLRTVTVPTRISEIPKLGGDQMHNLQPVQQPPWSQINQVPQPAAPSIEVKGQPVDVGSDLLSAPPSETKDPEKITLYGNETSAITVLENPVVPSLQIEAAVPSVSSTGLSPFLKFNNDNPQKQALSVPMLNVEDDSEIASTSNIDNYDRIEKRTPRSILKSRSKNNRLSMSTPRRRSSHIRALDFNTPSKSIKNARRMSTNESFEYSSKYTSFEKKVCRASLFKSPPFTTTPSPRKLKSPSKDRGSCKIPIATRSPAPKLMGGWEKYTGVGMILGCSSPSSSGSSPVKTPTTLEPTVKSWDEDLRKSLAINEEPTTTKSAKKILTKKSTTSNKRQSRRKNIPGTSAAVIDEASSDSEPFPVSNEPQNPAALPVRSTSGNPSETGQSTVEEKSEKLTKNVPDEISPESASLPEASKNIDMNNSAGRLVGNLMNNDVSGRTTKKKYAQLKTITTSVTKIERSSEILGNSSVTVEKIGEFSCTEKSRIMQLPDLLALETPRKFEGSFGIPPTPRLLSPSSNLTTPFAQIIDDVTKVQGFVSTPEFPPTPSINITPKHTSEDGTEKKEQFQTGSEYYEPSSKPTDPRPKRNNDHSRHDMSLPLPGMVMAIAAESRVKNISLEVAQGFQATTSTNKLEITQFEVIKENLPREEAFRELKISGCPSDVPNNDDLSISVQETSEISQISSEDDPHDTKDANNTSSTLDDSSDSDTSSSSDSSSTSSSSSSSSSTTNTSPNLTLDKQSPKTPACKIYTDTSNDSGQKSAQMCDNVASSVQEPATNDPNKNTALIDDSTIATVHASREENENSPTKVFPILKNDQQLEECIIETPAKDESLLSEAVISETPSSSKAGIETTNLESKISAFISSENQAVISEDSSTATKKALPKIVSIQRILPNVSIAMKPPPTSDNLYNAMQSRNQLKSMSDAKLSRHLEEKRLRVMAMFKEKEKAPLHRPRIKRAVVIARAKKQASEQEQAVETGRAEEEKMVEIDKKQEIRPESQEVNSTKETIGKDVETEKKNAPVNDEVTSSINIDAKNEKITTTKVAEETAMAALDEGKSKPSKQENMIRGGEVTTMEILVEEKEKTLKNENNRKSQKKQKEQTHDDILEGSGQDKRSKDEIPSERNDEERGKKGEGNKKSDDKRSDKPTEQKVAKSQRSRSVERTRTKTDPDIEKTAKPQKNLPQDFVNQQNFIDSQIPNENKIEEIENIIENTKNEKKESNMEKKEKKENKETVSVPIDAKAITKSKVDLVKRDLFSDEESNDQRTTRSKTRQTSDLQTSNNVDPHASSPSSMSEKNNSSPCANEDMPGVLECLDLVPTVKGDTNEEDFAIHDSSHSRIHADLNYVYDDSVPTKRRRRKFSSSELEFSIRVELSDGTFRQCSKLMTATPLEEMFSISPPRKRRGAAKEVKQTQAKKKDSLSVKKAKSAFKGIQDKPLATSSPVFKATTSKVAAKTSKSPKKIEPQPSDGKKKNNPTKDGKQQEHEKRNPKPRKRKASLSKDSEQVDKKVCRTNPQLLLDKLDLDKFLTTVHGPA